VLQLTRRMLQLGYNPTVFLTSFSFMVFDWLLATHTFVCLNGYHSIKLESQEFLIVFSNRKLPSHASHSALSLSHICIPAVPFRLEREDTIYIPKECPLKCQTIRLLSVSFSSVFFTHLQFIIGPFLMIFSKHKKGFSAEKCQKIDELKISKK